MNGEHVLTDNRSKQIFSVKKIYTKNKKLVPVPYRYLISSVSPRSWLASTAVVAVAAGVYENFFLPVLSLRGGKIIALKKVLKKMKALKEMKFFQKLLGQEKEPIFLT